jgi:hypothetical protein
MSLQKKRINALSTRKEKENKQIERKEERKKERKKEGK